MLIAAKNFPAMRFGGRILYSKTASEVDRRAMQLLKVLDTKRDHSGRAFIGFDIEWRPSFRKGIYAWSHGAFYLYGCVCSLLFSLDHNMFSSFLIYL